MYHMYHTYQHPDIKILIVHLVPEINVCISNGTSLMDMAMKNLKRIWMAGLDSVNSRVIMDAASTHRVLGTAIESLSLQT